MGRFGRRTPHFAGRALLAFAATWLLATAVGAEGPGAPGKRRGPPPIERVLERHAERLGLDDDTRARIRELSSEGRDAGRAHREALRALRDELRELLSQDAPKESEVFAKADEIGRAETALQKERLRTMLAIRALLTPEQRSELVKIHDEMRGERRGRGRRGERPEPSREPDEGNGEGQ